MMPLMHTPELLNWTPRTSILKHVYNCSEVDKQRVLISTTPQCHKTFTRKPIKMASESHLGHNGVLPLHKPHLRSMHRLLRAALPTGHEILLRFKIRRNRLLQQNPTIRETQ